MTHVVTSKCVDCKYTDCVEVCPVNCFYELSNQLVIHAVDCVDCTACVTVCPVEAIYVDVDVPAEFHPDIEFNEVEAGRAKDAGEQPIVKMKEALPTAAARKAELGY